MDIAKGPYVGSVEQAHSVRHLRVTVGWLSSVLPRSLAAESAPADHGRPGHADVPGRSEPRTPRRYRHHASESRSVPRDVREAGGGPEVPDRGDAGVLE